MLGFIKDLFGKRAEAPRPSAPAPAPAAPSPAPPPGQPPAARPGPLPARPKGKVERILLSLRAITDHFPEELRPLLAQPPGEGVIIALPAEPILQQLPTGQVSVTLGDLRRVAPFNVFVPDTSRDEERVPLPLSELLAHLDPSSLKRQDQRRVELPSRIDSVFVKRGEGDPSRVTSLEPGALEPGAAPAPAPPGSPRPAAATPPPPAPTAPAAPAPPRSDSIPAPAEMSAPPTPTPAPEAPEPVRRAPGLAAPAELSALFETAKPAAPAPEASAPPPVSPAPTPSPAPRPVRDAEPKPAARPPKSINLFTPPKPEAFRKTSPIPVPASEAPAAAAPAIPVVALGRGPIIDAPPPRPPTPPPVAKTVPPASALGVPKAAIPAPAPISAPVPKVPAAPAAPAAAPSGAATIALPLAEVSEAWPEAIREEIAGAAPGSVIEYPAADLGTALRAGKVAQPWHCLREMIRPPLLAAGESLYAEALLELPLRVVAPRFMAAGAAPGGAGGAGRKRVAIDDSIPSPFAAAAPPPAPAPAAAGTSAKESGALGLDGRLPSQLVERACSLSGVAGAVIALQEGLVVAAKVPPEFAQESVAAFLPQLFSRLEESMERMKIGELQNLMFTAGDRPWQIWKAGNVFFAAMGRPNELLPGAQLKVIAAQLARHTQR